MKKGRFFEKLMCIVLCFEILFSLLDNVMAIKASTVKSKVVIHSIGVNSVAYDVLGKKGIKSVYIFTEDGNNTIFDEIIQPGVSSSESIKNGYRSYDSGLREDTLYYLQVKYKNGNKKKIYFRTKKDTQDYKELLDNELQSSAFSFWIHDTASEKSKNYFHIKYNKKDLDGLSELIDVNIKNARTGKSIRVSKTSKWKGRKWFSSAWSGDSFSLPDKNALYNIQLQTTRYIEGVAYDSDPITIYRCSPVSKLKKSSTSSNKVNLSWEKTKNAVEYTVYGREIEWKKGIMNHGEIFKIKTTKDTNLTINKVGNKKIKMNTNTQYAFWILPKVDYKGNIYTTGMGKDELTYGFVAYGNKVYTYAQWVYQMRKIKRSEGTYSW